MKYVLLSYAPPGVWETLSEAEREAWNADDAEFNAELDRRGVVVTGFRLAEADTATTVRADNGEVTVTDGPFAEITEHLGGFLVIEVPDLDAALDIASRCPAARVGPLEVRPLRTG